MADELTPGSRAVVEAHANAPDAELLARLKAHCLEVLRAARMPECSPALAQMLGELLDELEAGPRGAGTSAERIDARSYGRDCAESGRVSVEALMGEFRLLRSVVDAGLEALSVSEPLLTQVADRVERCAEQAVAGYVDGRTAQANRELAELETVIASAPEAIYVGTRDGIARANPPALDMLGVSSVEQLRERGGLDAVLERRDPLTHQVLSADELPFARALRGEVSARDVEVVPPATGEPRIIRSRAAPIRVEGQIVAAVAVNSDLTHERRTEEELAQALRHRDELLSVASHELRTPMSALLLQLQLMERLAARRPDGSLGAEDLARSLPSAIRQAKRVGEMLGRLLDLSRLRTGRFNLDVGTVELCSLVHDILGRMRPQAEQAGSPLQFVDCTEIFVYGDAMRLEQVLTNLLTNAVKYGRGKPIEVALERRGEDAVISVRDQGMGIAAEDQARIFERFERATSEQKQESLGLGLFISREIVKAHHGRIEVVSQPGQGATFRVVLPTHAPGMESSPSGGGG